MIFSAKCFIIYYMCEYVCVGGVGMYHSICVEVGGQLVGFNSLLPSFGNGTQVISLGGK